MEQRNTLFLRWTRFGEVCIGPKGWIQNTYEEHCHRDDKMAVYDTASQIGYYQYNISNLGKKNSREKDRNFFSRLLGVQLIEKTVLMTVLSFCGAKRNPPLSVPA
jgi:hypothetical protein